MNKAFLFFALLICSFSTVAIDTTFVGAYPVQDLVNVDSYNNDLYVRTATALFIFSEGELLPTENIVEKRYTWILNDGQFGTYGIYHTDFLPMDKAVGNYIERILPGKIYPTISAAQVHDRLFVTYGDQILEYRIDTHYSRSLPEFSIRSVWSSDDTRYIAAYGGIFKGPETAFQTNELVDTFIRYSNGEINFAHGHLYLCYDDIGVITDTGITRVGRGSNQYKYRSLHEYGTDIIALRTFGIELFDQNLVSKGVYFKNSEFGDLEIWDNQIIAGSTAGYIIRFTPGRKITDSVFTGEVTDLFLWRDTLNASTPNGIIRLDSSLKIIDRIEHPDVLQTVQIGNYLVFSTLSGLFAYNRNRIVALIPKVEFNKKALYLYGHNLFAGSVQGLYQMKRYYLEDVILPNANRNIIETKPTSSYWAISIGLLFALLLTIAIRMPRFRKNEDLIIPYETHNMASLEILIRESPEIQSVNDLAERLQTSTVQLNRKLKKEGTTPGKLINRVKGDIARQLYQEGLNTKEIAKRVGYSERYVKEKFLKENP